VGPRADLDPWRRQNPLVHPLIEPKFLRLPAPYIVTVSNTVTVNALQLLFVRYLTTSFQLLQLYMTQWLSVSHFKVGRHAEIKQTEEGE